MAAIQLNFTLRTSANVKTVHLIGSWDNYNGQLPLSRDTQKAGGWKGTFRFQGQSIKQGQRYWYYYIIDGYHVSHDPARDAVVEPTTGRKLNVLDIPSAKSSDQPSTATSKSSRHSRRMSMYGGVPKGRPLDSSEIQSPRPYKPQETRKVRHEQFHHATLELLNAKFATTRIDDESEDDDSDSDCGASSSDLDSDVPSLSSRSSNSSTPSSVSSVSSCCTCERYGITRAGARVKLDCGGSRCGSRCGSADGSECNSDSDGEYKRGTTRRHGIVVRH